MSLIYNSGLEYLNEYKWSTSTIYVLLVTNSYTASRSHEFVDDVSSYEVTGTGYSRKQISSPTITLVEVDNILYFDGLDISWSSLDVGVIAGAIIYAQINDDTDSILIAYINDGGFPINTLQSPVTIVWNSLGIIQTEDDT